MENPKEQSLLDRMTEIHAKVINLLAVIHFLTENINKEKAKGRISNS